MITMHPRVSDVLEQSSVSYTVHNHSGFPEPINLPSDFAGSLGVDLERITKTLLLKSKETGQYAVVTCSCIRKIDFNKMKEITGFRKIEMAQLSELEETLGYPLKGVSPIGVPSAIPVYIDSEVLNFDTVFIGAGQSGIDIEIKPQDLVVIAKGQLVGFTVPAQVH